MAFHRTDCVEKPISNFFVIPLIMSAALGGGLYFLKDRENNGVEKQFTPINGPSKQARHFVKETFPSNDSLFSKQRLYAEGNYSVIIFSVVEGNVLTDALFEEISELDKQVHSLSVKANQTQISFKDILGGVEERGGMIQQARAIRLFYFLQDNNGTSEWLQQFQNVLSKKKKNYTYYNFLNLQVSHFTSLSRQEEIEKHTTDGIPLFSITYSLAISFSVLSCMRKKRKPVCVCVFWESKVPTRIVQVTFYLINIAYKSYIIKASDDQKLFSSYGPNVMVVVTEELPYWNKSSRSELNHCLNLDNENVFMENVSSFFQRYPEFKLDVNIAEGKINASRFFVQTLDISNTNMEIMMSNELRITVQSCSAAKLLVFHPLFICLDQYLVIVTGTIQNVGFTTAVMLVVSLLLIPNPICSLWVTFSIGSVVTGVTGFMALWGVNLDSISMIILVVCIGFTVDFSAHIPYAFVSSKKSTANERAVDALFSLGYPVLQGAALTIIGILILAASKNHIFRTFFNIMFLVMIFGLAHSIIFSVSDPTVLQFKQN
uniref:SSD domain-containing protein n=1 Tax=Sinocyclocheilus rhinocerous TaxID=307959 RepID=A0A673L9P5_9TELE